MRAAMDACSVTGTLPRPDPCAGVTTARTDKYASFGELTGDLLSEDGFPAARPAMIWPIWRTDESGPNSSVTNAEVFRIAQRCEGDGLRAGEMCQSSAISGRQLISTNEGVWGITVRKSASMDSLTSSIQCASSMTKTAGWVRAELGGVDQRRQPASPCIGVDLGQLHIGIGDAHHVIKQHQVLRIGVCEPFPHLCPRGLMVETARAADRAPPDAPPHETRYRGMRFAERRKHLDIKLFGKSALLGRSGSADARRADHRNHRIAFRLWSDPASLPVWSTPSRGVPALYTRNWSTLRGHAQQPPRRHRFPGALDVHQLRRPQLRSPSTSRAVTPRASRAAGGAPTSLR